MERRFRRDIGVLPEIFAFVEERLLAERLDPENAFWIDLVLEELFTNVVKYGRDGTRDVAIDVSSEGDRLVLRVTAFDGQGFDITRVPEVDLEAYGAERRVGGLGIHFVRRIADTISYERRDHRSIITVTKRLEK